MFLTQQDISQTREHSLNNLLGLSSACLEASQHFSELFAAAGRDALYGSSKHWAGFSHGQLESLIHFPVALWLEQSTRNSKLLNAAYEILGATHKSLIQTAESQVRTFDHLVFASLNRASRSSPWEFEIALQAMKTTLKSAETTLHEMSAAAIESVELASPEAHLPKQAIASTLPPPEKPLARTRSRTR